MKHAKHTNFLKHTKHACILKRAKHANCLKYAKHAISWSTPNTWAHQARKHAI